MKKFELYGDMYPADSKYARLMAQYMITPNYDSNSKKEWELYRDFAVKKRMGDNEMKAFLVAKDSSHHNMILGRSPRDSRDLEQVYSRQFGKSASSREYEKKLKEVFRLLQRRFGQARRWHESGFEDQYFHIDNGIMFFSYTTGLRGEAADDSDLEDEIRIENKQEVAKFLKQKGYDFVLDCTSPYCETLILTLKGKEWMKNNRPRYAKQAEDECSGKTDTMDYVKCRATKMEKEQGTPADKAFPTAWSIACKYKRDQLSDADEHCQKKPSEYFKSKKANGDSMKNRKKTSTELEMTAGHTPESFKKMMEENPELAEEWQRQIKENEGVVAALSEKWAGCENLPNEKMQQMCEDKKKDSKEDDKEDGKDKKAHLNRKQENLLKRLRNPALAHEDLSPRVQQSLHNELVKEVDAWLSEEYFGRSLMATRTMEAGVSDLFSKPHESVRNFVAEEDIMAGHTEESFKKMMKENPELEKEWKEQIKKNEGVVGKKAQDKEYEDDIKAIGTKKYKGIASFWNKEYKHTLRSKSRSEKKRLHDELLAAKLDPSGKSKAHEDIIYKKKAHDKTARLMKRQIKILELFVKGRPSIPLFFDALPPKIQDGLKRVKYQETLEMDVNRWLGDYRMEQQLNQNRWASNNSSAKENPMNKTARVALRTLTANWGLTVDETYEMLAEDELGEYLSEMEAEMWAEEMEAGRSKNPANGGFKVYEKQENPSEPYYDEKWWKPNTSNQDKGGNGAGGTKNFNHNYHEYGSMAGKSEKEYQKSYYQKRFVENKPIKRTTCPKFHGRKGPCDAPLPKKKN